MREKKKIIRENSLFVNGIYDIFTIISWIFGSIFAFFSNFI